MKPVSTSQDSYMFPPSYIDSGTAPITIEIVSPRITQISGDEAEIGGVSQRADSFKAVYVSEPFAIVSLKIIDLSTGLEDPTLLRNIQLSTSITTFDTYVTGTNGISEDTFVQDTKAFATLGRFYFDLRKYITSQIKLSAINRAGFNLQLVVRVEVFSAKENHHYKQSEKTQVSSPSVKTINLRRKSK